MPLESKPLLTAFGLNGQSRLACRVGSTMERFLVLAGFGMVVAALLYFSDVKPIFTVGSLEFTEPDFVVLVLVLVVVVRCLGKGFYGLSRRIAVPFACYFIATAISALTAGDKLRSLGALAQMLEFLALMWGMSLLTSYRSALRIIHFMLAAFVFESALAAWQFISMSGDPSFRFPHGTFLTNQKYSEFCGAAAALAYGLFIGTREKSMRLIYFLTMIVLLIGAVLGQERAPWLAFLVSGVLITFVSSRGRKRAGLALKFAAAILLVVLVVAAIPQVRDKVVSRIAEAESQKVSKNTLLSRLAVWAFAWQLFQAHPLLGVGPKNFMTLSPHFLTIEETGYVEGADPHNVWLANLAEGGVLGFVTYLSFCFGVIALAYNKLRRDDATHIRAMLLAYLAYNFFMITMSNYYFVKVEGHMHFLVLGLMLGLLRDKSNSPSRADLTKVVSV